MEHVRYFLRLSGKADWGKLAMMGGGLILYAGLLTLFGWDAEDHLVINRLRRNVFQLRT
jgi:hypothetical protein